MDARAPQSEAAEVGTPITRDRPVNLIRRALRGGNLRTAEGRQRLRGPLMIGGTAIVAAVALAMWLMGGRYQSTDDAYVHARKLMVSAEVSGKVANVDIKEGDVVQAGQALFRLDPQPFEIALANAKAKLSQAGLDVESMKADYQRLLSGIEAQKSQVALAQHNFDRVAKLASAHYESRAAYDQARFTLASAQNTVQSLKSEAEMQLAKLDGNAEIAPADHPEVRSAQAAVDEAQRQLNATVVRAPFNGTVTQVSGLQPGTYLVSMMAAFVATSAVGLVSTGDMWVDASLKETQLSNVKVGEPVRVKVDTYPGKAWKGTVCAISPASGSEFSMLPAVNSSGNWVKVVQRLNVRVCLAQSSGNPPLRAGLSASVRIDTGHKRSLGDLL